jgi:hypothetical protein
MASVTWNPGINSSNPTITMTVTQGTQNIANNTTVVSWSLVLKRPSNVSSSVNKPYSVVIDGVTVASGSTSIAGSGDKTIASGTRTIQHGSDGKKTISFSFTVDVMPLYWSGTPTGNASGSGSMTLTTIPRASTLDSFSLPNALMISTATSFSLKITRASSSFTHDIQLRDGTTVLQSWNGQGVPTSLTISSSVVNTLLSRMSTVTSKTLTLWVQTKSGSTNIGSAVTRTATVSVHSSVTPTASGLSVSVYGSGRDKTINKFVQNISRVTASFTGTARGGASVSSRKIVIRRTSDGSNSQTISSGSGTTSGRVTLSGTYEAIATVTDSRGRSATQRITFTVHAYSPPKITSFTAVRNSSTPTTVNIGRYGSWSSLGGDNSITIVIRRGSTTIQNVSGTSGSISGTLVDTGRSVTSSYTYTVTATDSFGNSASASVTVSTQKVVLDIHKNEGVGIGKIHEQGVLDIDGSMYLTGFLHVNGRQLSRPDGLAESVNGLDMNDITDTGFYQGYNMTNSAASGNISTFIVMKYSNHWIVQVQFVISAPVQVYIRSYHSGSTWSAWTKLH